MISADKRRSMALTNMAALEEAMDDATKHSLLSVFVPKSILNRETLRILMSNGYDIRILSGALAEISWEEDACGDLCRCDEGDELSIISMDEALLLINKREQ